MSNYFEIYNEGIKSINFINHSDDIELSGEKVSGIVYYSYYDTLKINIELIYPMLRISPNKTRDSYKFNVISKICPNEELVDIIIDGVLTITSKLDDSTIIRKYYPSTTLACFYEEIEVVNGKPLELNDEILNVKDGVDGIIYLKKVVTSEGNKQKVSYYASYDKDEFITEENSLLNRIERLNEITNKLKLTTDNKVLDTMFRFAKIRACESVFRTKNGLIHSPGGGNYYAAIWCNDELEYITPFYAFMNDNILNEAVKNHIGWYLPYLNCEFKPIPSSIISEGTDYWDGVGDRGDSSMLLFGASRYFLASGRTPNVDELKVMNWCAQYILTKKNEYGIIESDSDELENRISSGKMNLNTNCLSYEGLRLFSILLERMNSLDDSIKYKDISSKLKEDIIKYFSANIYGYDTYRYHDGCEDIRAWSMMPLYMKFNHNVDGTVDSIEDHLYSEGSLRSTMGEEILWDRSTLYYIAALFRSGYTYLGYTRLLEYSKKRLLADRVPYPVEAYPEYKMRHLSGESALYARIIIDGILGI